MGHKEEQLFTALAVAAERRMRDFNSQEIANTAWAFATVGHKDERLFSTLAAAAERRTMDCPNAFATESHNEGCSLAYLLT